MKDIFIADIKERDRIEEVFLVSKKEMPISKGGKPYLNLKFMDRTGDIEGRIWEDAMEIAKVFEKDDFVKIRGWAVLYQGKIQLNVSFIEQYPEEKVSLEDFLPSAIRDGDEMMKELETLSHEIRNRYLKRLLKLFLSDEKIRVLWKKAPAAKSMHHTYLGGLLEHTLSISRLVLDVSKQYRENLSKWDRGIDEDLLLTGAVLHDIGKIYELSYDRSFNYTDEGRLLGHITIGIEMIEEKIAKIPDFPQELAMLLKHMVLSHHGYLEYGSPKRPKTLEAIILYYIDDLDSKVQSIQSLIEKEGKDNSRWTAYHKLYERYIYKGKGSYKQIQDNYLSNEGERRNSSAQGHSIKTDKEHQKELEGDLFADVNIKMQKSK